MRDLFKKLAAVLDRRAKKRLLLAIIGTIFIAAVDTLAIALVLPLVDVASGTALDHGAAATIASVLYLCTPNQTLQQPPPGAVS